MNTVTQEQAIAAYRRAPALVREAFDDEATTRVVVDLKGRYQLHVDTAGVVGQQLGYMLLGLVTPTEFVEHLKGAGIQPQIVDAIVTDVNQRVFAPLREKMRKGGNRQTESLQEKTSAPHLPAPPPSARSQPAMSYEPPAPPAPAPASFPKSHWAEDVPPPPASARQAPSPRMWTPPPSAERRGGAMAPSPEPPQARPYPSYELPALGRRSSPAAGQTTYAPYPVERAQSVSASLPPKHVLPAAPAQSFARPVPPPEHSYAPSPAPYVPPNLPTGSPRFGEGGIRESNADMYLSYPPPPEPAAPWRQNPSAGNAYRNEPASNELPPLVRPPAIPPSYPSGAPLPPLSSGADDSATPHTRYSSDPYREPIE